MNNMTKINELNNTIENLYAEIDNRMKTTEEEITKLLEENLPDWKVNYLDRCTIEFELKNDRFTRLQFYHGKEYDYKADKTSFKFEMNCAAFGSFSVMDSTSSSFKYYEAVGKILGNVELKEAFKNALFNLYNETTEISKKIKTLNNEKHALEDEENAKAKIAGQKETVARHAEYKKGYVVAKVSELGCNEEFCQATYHNMPIYFPTLNVYPSVEEAKKEYDGLGRYVKKNYRIISLKMIKSI